MVRWDGGTVEDALWPVRSLRATPPGLAASGRRGKVFQAALGQFEELLRASQAVGPACSPILLYYALSQAGRAILAAHGRRDAWDAHGHGLAVETIRDPIGTTTIKPREGGLFPAVAATTGSPILTSPVTLSGAWGGTPGFARAPGLGDDVPPVFLLSENGGEATVRSVDGGPLQFEEFWHRQDLYPGGSQAVFDPVHFTGRGVEGLVVFRLVSFPDEQAQRLFYDSLVSLGGNRYVRAPLGQSSDQPSGLMTLWVVLIALSSLARYEPAGWTLALTPKSPLAVPIEQTLKRVTLLLPRLVHDALVEPDGNLGSRAESVGS